MHIVGSYRLWLSRALLIPLLAFGTIGNTKPLVVSSIKPLQLLVTAVAGDHVSSQLLLPSTASPHLYHLRPSDRLQLQSADLVVWVGPDLERFLLKPLSLLPTNRVAELGAELKLGNSAPLHHSEHSAHPHHDDLHVWLNPDYAVQMAKHIAERLMQLDPGHSGVYYDNWERFRQRIKKIDERIRSELSPLSDRRYIVLHDAYRHFEQHYGLQHLAALTVNPERRPGAKHLMSIRRKVQEHGVHCLFLEPQYSPKSIASALSHLPDNTGVLDPLATSIEVSMTGYESFLKNFSREFCRCLGR